MLEIRTSLNQVGMTVEARNNGGDWVTVQVARYKERGSTSVRQYSTCIDPARDEAEYFAEIDRRGIAYKRVRS